MNRRRVSSGCGLDNAIFAKSPSSMFWSALKYLVVMLALLSPAGAEKNCRDGECDSLLPLESCRFIRNQHGNRLARGPAHVDRGGSNYLDDAACLAHGARTGRGCSEVLIHTYTDPSSADTEYTEELTLGAEQFIRDCLPDGYEVVAGRGPFGTHDIKITGDPKGLASAIQSSTTPSGQYALMKREGKAYGLPEIDIIKYSLIQAMQSGLTPLADPEIRRDFERLLKDAVDAKFKKRKKLKPREKKIKAQLKEQIGRFIRKNPDLEMAMSGGRVVIEGLRDPCGVRAEVIVYLESIGKSENYDYVLKRLFAKKGDPSSGFLTEYISFKRVPF